MKNIIKKVQKELPSFVDEVNTLKPEELDQRLNTLVKGLDEIVEQEKEDEYVSELSEKLKVAKSIYNENKKIVKMKIKYLIEELKSRGKV